MLARSPLAGLTLPAGAIMIAEYGKGYAAGLRVEEVGLAREAALALATGPPKPRLESLRTLLSRDSSVWDVRSYRHVQTSRKPLRLPPEIPALNHRKT